MKQWNQAGLFSPALFRSVNIVLYVFKYMLGVSI